jgi:hypothetical protein
VPFEFEASSFAGFGANNNGKEGNNIHNIIVERKKKL